MWNVFIVTVTVLIALTAHFIEIAVWGWLLEMCGRFSEVGAAFYQSAMIYTTLGYNEAILPPSWRMLGPLEAADGLLMFAVSTGMIFAVIQRLISTRFKI